jgi:hypothetical protein
MKYRQRCCWIWLEMASILLVFMFFSCESDAAVTVEPSSNGAVIKIEGQLFTEYLTQSGSQPILWPIIGPTGKAMTRAYPMQDNTGEKTDHPWHRSMWFSHGDVNGIDFWTEKPGHGTIKHRKFVKLESGATGLIVTENEWLSPDGIPQCTDRRTLVFGNDTDTRWIDFGIVIHALDKPVVFGDSKEGTFGLRVAENLSVDAKQGGVIVNSNGQTNGTAWGKAASWVDYHGSLNSEKIGIAILNHPGSFRYPTFWHVREYGLFAANPFGLKDFSGDSKKNGSYTIEPGKSISLRYRVLFHRGDEITGKISEAFSNYSKLDE